MTQDSAPRSLPVGRIGYWMVGLAVVLLFAAYPPIPGVPAGFGLPGIGAVVLPMALSLVLAVGGSVLVGRSVADSRSSTVERVAVRLGIVVVVVGVIGGLLATVAGFSPGTATAAFAALGVCGTLAHEAVS
jgi:formate/nitrite transporter FocA (FNT family)